LQHSLRGRAATLLTEYGAESRDWSFEQTVDKLQDRFGQKNVKERFEEELRAIRRGSNESIPALDSRVRVTMTRAYGATWQRSEFGQGRALDHFLRGLNDPDLQLRIRDRDPKSLDDAVRFAIRLELNSEICKPKDQPCKSVKQVSQAKSQSKSKSKSKSGKSKQKVTFDTSSDEDYVGPKTKSSLKKKKAAAATSAPCPADTAQTDKLEKLETMVAQMQQMLTSPSRNVSSHGHSPPPPGHGSNPGYNQNKGVHSPRFRRPPKCYTCGYEGHVAAYCPFSAQGPSASQTTQGTRNTQYRPAPSVNYPNRSPTPILPPTQPAPALASAPASHSQPYMVHLPPAMRVWGLFPQKNFRS
jgi:hypothetical protein